MVTIEKLWMSRWIELYDDFAFMNRLQSLIPISHYCQGEINPKTVVVVLFFSFFLSLRVLFV